MFLESNLISGSVRLELIVFWRLLESIQERRAGRLRKRLFRDPERPLHLVGRPMEVFRSSSATSRGNNAPSPEDALPCHRVPLGGAPSAGPDGGRVVPSREAVATRPKRVPRMTRRRPARRSCSELLLSGGV